MGRYSYESFLSPRDRTLISDTYVSSIQLDSMPELPPELKDHIWDYSLLPDEQDISSEVQPKVPPRDRTSDAPGAWPSQPDAATNANEGMPPVEQAPLGLKATVRWCADPNLLRASASIRYACKEREQKWKTLVLRDSDLYNFHHIILPPAHAGVRFCELCLILFCHSCPFMNHTTEGNCRATAEIARHKSWIEDVLAQLYNLRSLSIFIHLAHSDFIPGQKTKLPCEDLVERRLEDLKALPKVQELVLYRYKFDEHGSEPPDFDGTKDLVSRWTRPEPANRIDRARLQ